MATEIQRQRYEKIFNNFDFDGDGDIDKADIDALVHSWCQIFDVAPGSHKWRQITRLADRWWRDLIGRIDSDGNKIVSKEEWVSSFGQPGFIDNVAVPFGLAAFDLGDKDDDGKLSRDDHRKGTTAGRATAVESSHVFSNFDTDGDGYITKEEARKGLEKFYKGTEPDTIVDYMV